MMVYTVKGGSNRRNLLKDNNLTDHQSSSRTVKLLHRVSFISMAIFGTFYQYTDNKKLIKKRKIGSPNYRIRIIFFSIKITDKVHTENI